MNPITGVIRAITVEGGVPVARVSVEGALVRVSLVFVQDAAVGDTILISSGIAISRLYDPQSQENPDVSGHPGQGTGD